jgi:hypothetical protein
MPTRLTGLLHCCFKTQASIMDAAMPSKSSYYLHISKKQSA